METMYDRLGDLLSETLEAGHVKFVKPKISDNQSQKKEPSVKEPEVDAQKEKLGQTRTENRGQKKNSTEYEKSYASGQKATGTIIKYVSPELERAYRLLGIPMGSSKDDVKKAYKEKLQYYHPDKHIGNPILEKVATDKTRQVVDAYNLISENL
ncbi:J domain-containing protein [Treponema sp.]|uniref:J domain-containing protein n=1 Tax=Treponema sp. TaxID=166 RepID=UPI00388F6816